MKRDFTLEILKELLVSLKSSGYNFVPFKDYFKVDIEKVVVLRHDVDKLPINSLRFAQIQNRLGIRGTYYFRIVKDSFNPDVIKKIVSLDHEIGYHYEDLAFAKGNIDKAYELYNKHIREFRKYYDVKTICMHGSPLSRYDNKDIWKKYSYKDCGIISEPYFDLNFDDIFYITDTGRRWDGSNVSVRDKVKSGFKEKYKSTKEIINAVHQNEFPNKAMITFHPQRWSDSIIDWSNELAKQKTKNIIKKFIAKKPG